MMATHPCQVWPVASDGCSSMACRGCTGPFPVDSVGNVLPRTFNLASYSYDFERAVSCLKRATDLSWSYPVDSIGNDLPMIYSSSSCSYDYERALSCLKRATPLSWEWVDKDFVLVTEKGTFVFLSTSRDVIPMGPYTLQMAHNLFVGLLWDVKRSHEDSDDN